jgi:hypothetical protein
MMKQQANYPLLWGWIFLVSFTELCLVFLLAWVFLPLAMGVLTGEVLANATYQQQLANRLMGCLLIAFPLAIWGSIAQGRFIADWHRQAIDGLKDMDVEVIQRRNRIGVAIPVKGISVQLMLEKKRKWNALTATQYLLMEIPLGQKVANGESFTLPPTDVATTVIENGEVRFVKVARLQKLGKKISPNFYREELKSRISDFVDDVESITELPRPRSGGA